MHHYLRLLVLLSLLMLQCSNINPPKPKLLRLENNKLPLEKIRLPEGFKIDLFAKEVKNARSLCLSPKGTLFVGTRSEGNVYALQDTDGDKKADKQYLIAKGLKMPNGVAFHKGALFVAEVSRIIRFDDIENRLANPPTPVVVYDKYPSDTHHGWKYIAFGPDGKLYVPVGAPCNICEPEKIYASITRINPDGSGLEIVQSGIRNTVGFAWHPDTKDLWFTDNGRDWMGDDLPACELNRANRDSLHFGYPYCHQGDLSDPEFGNKRPCSEFVQPVQKMGPHTAPLGIEFYTGKMFPEMYKKQAFIAEHGSWNRSKKIGYQISLVTLDQNFKALGYTAFADGWLDKATDEPWGRPVDIELMPDGSMLVSDDFADCIYRIYYDKK